MQFTEFQDGYLADQPPGVVTPRGADTPGPLYVGHVAIVRMDGGRPLIVEAVEPSVRHLAYDAWIADRGQDDIWHGRIRDRSGPERARMADEAVKYVGVRYRFFNFNLNDASGTYCSKLAWLATFRSLSLALDDNPNPFRFPWYSPKRLMRSPHICLLFDPGGYTDNVPTCSS
jgi:uncharacterized protein YycO